MSNILLASAYECGKHTGVLDEMFSLRYKVFFERLGWDVSIENFKERDIYDDLNPIYMVVKNDKQHIEGCWRILPTIGPYMLKNTFPQLLRSEKAPESREIWELSRFAVISGCNISKHRKTPLGSVAMSMIRTVFDFAEQHGVKQYVTVTSVALERLLKKIAIPIHRFGDEKSQHLGKVNSVACWIAVN